MTAEVTAERISASSIGERRRFALLCWRVLRWGPLKEADIRQSGIPLMGVAGAFSLLTFTHGGVYLLVQVRQASLHFRLPTTSPAMPRRPCTEFRLSHTLSYCPLPAFLPKSAAWDAEDRLPTMYPLFPSLFCVTTRGGAGGER